VIRQWQDGLAHPWPVGRLKPNDWGLFDTLGNVAEWCHDLEAEPGLEGREAQAFEVSFRTVRGGSYLDPPGLVRAAARGQESTVYVGGRPVGFRVARTLPADPP
jgi:formylglycine-generating enzyme required for sulfatase activity